MTWRHRKKGAKPPKNTVSVYVFGVGPQAEGAQYTDGGFYMPFYVFGLNSDGSPVPLKSIRILFEPGDSRNDILKKVETEVQQAANDCSLNWNSVDLVIHGL